MYRRDHQLAGRLLGGALMAGLAGGLTACSPATPPPGSAAAAMGVSTVTTSSSTGAAGGRLTASPNPVGGLATRGQTTLSWQLPDGDRATIKVAPDGQSQLLFATGASRGAAQAAFIVAGHTYEFTLYSSVNPGRPVASVRVVRPPGRAP